MSDKLSDLEKQMKYPHAVKYITSEGIARASKETLQTWEYEASICSKVEYAVAGKDAVGRLRCPKCDGEIFRFGDTIVNYEVPFVSMFRITPSGFRSDYKVQCICCRTTFGFGGK